MLCLCTHSSTALPCDAWGHFLPPGSNPQLKMHNPNNWTPFSNQIQFEITQFLYKWNQMSATHMDILFYLWAATLRDHGDSLPFRNHNRLYHTIDKISLGDVKWNNFAVEFTGEVPNIPNPPMWMKQQYEVWYRDPCEVVHQLLGNPDFAKKIDLQPYHEFMTEGDVQQYGDFMSGDWAWQQAVSKHDLIQNTSTNY